MNESQTSPQPNSSLNLRVGDWVEVRSADEILATLDEHQAVQGLPFMPNMLRHCGQRYRVLWSAHKTADTIELFAIRKMANAVHLELRCDGSSHGGCQAGCLIFWKECWLKRVPGPANRGTSMKGESTTDRREPACALAENRLAQGTRRPVKAGEPERFRCQATEILNATADVRRRERWDPRFYVRDLTSGNVKPVDFIRYGALAMLNGFLRRWFNYRTYPYVRGLAGDKTPTCELNLKPGDLVRVKTKREIQLTLNSQRKNRGLWFDIEMLQFCGKGNYRVLRRVEKIVNEKTGEMMHFKNPCIVLDGVTCTGNYLPVRMFSRRHEYIYWREIWLERMEERLPGPH